MQFILGMDQIMKRTMKVKRNNLFSAEDEDEKRHVNINQ